jgi:hypothetical protein
MRVTIFRTVTTVLGIFNGLSHLQVLQVERITYC